MHARSRLAARVAVVGLSLAAVALPIAATQARADTAPTLTVTSPDSVSSLQNDTVLTLSGSGFDTTGGGTVYIVECSGLTGQAECDTPHLATATLDGSGDFSGATITVHNGAIGNGTCPGKVAGDQCYILANSNPGDPTSVSALGAVPITFAPVVTASPNTNVKTGQKLSVTGYGFPANKMAFVLECANPPSATTCDAGTIVNPKTTANGTFSTKLTVHIGAFGNVRVKPGDTATVSATTDLTGKVPNASGGTEITFSKTQPVAPTHTSIKATAKAHGKKVTVAGVIKGGSKGVAGLKVTVYERAKGTHKWKNAGKATSKKGGKFTVSEKHFGHAEQYIVKHAKQTVSKKVYSASSSKTLTVKG